MSFPHVPASGGNRAGCLLPRQDSLRLRAANWWLLKVIVVWKGEVNT